MVAESDSGWNYIKIRKIKPNYPLQYYHISFKYNIYFLVKRYTLTGGFVFSTVLFCLNVRKPKNKASWLYIASLCLYSQVQWVPQPTMTFAFIINTQIHWINLPNNFTPVTNFEALLHGPPSSFITSCLIPCFPGSYDLFIFNSLIWILDRNNKLIFLF